MKYAVKDLAELFSVPDRTVRQWIEHEELPADRVGGKFLVGAESVIEWCTLTGKRIPAVLLTSSASATETPLPSLHEILRQENVVYDVPGSSKTDFFSAVVEKLVLPPRADRALIREVLLAREMLGSTGIGGGIAIPHPRTPIVLPVPTPSVTLAFPVSPLEFDSMDAQPVHALFILICPTIRMHLHIISRLAFALHDASFNEALRARAEPLTIIAALRQAEGPLDKRTFPRLPGGDFPGNAPAGNAAGSASGARDRA